MKNAKLIDELKGILAPEDLLLDGEEFEHYFRDYKTGFFGIPTAVCFPRNTDQAQSLILLSQKLGIPIVPRGAGTGRSGGAVPPDHSLVISMEKMQNIYNLDPENLSIDVEAGTILADLQTKVEANNLFYPPDPASFDRCTLGGNVAENAGGPRAFKYGVTRDYILALKVILPNGEIVNMGSKARKHVAGYDLTRLLVGSEGTLGLITNITLRLLPKPQCHHTQLLLLDSLEKTAQLINRVIQKNIIPASMELLDKIALDILQPHFPNIIPEKAKAALLIELDGSPSSIESQIQQMTQLLNSFPLLALHHAQNPHDAEKLWNIRRSLSDLLRKYYPFKISEDIAVPRTQLPHFVKTLQQLSLNSPVDIVQYGHAGDGNLHINFLWHEKYHRQIAENLIEKVLRLAIQLGGTITGEHGIGLTKKEFLPWEQSVAMLEAERAIKEALDPHYLMNPGKIFPVPPHITPPIFHED